MLQFPVPSTKASRIGEAVGMLSGKAGVAPGMEKATNAQPHAEIGNMLISSQEPGHCSYKLALGW
jgi:hypothetical protein